MDIHKPKAAHSWREFAIEIGTIITGILIALALEQAVEAYHWRAEVREAHRALAGEVAGQARSYVYRIAVYPCVERRLAEIEAILSDVDHGQRVAPVADFGRPTGTGNLVDVWQALGASGVLSHFKPEELVAYSRMYSVSALFDSWSTMGGQDWSTIKLVVGDPNRLTPSDRSLVRVAINHTRALNNVWGAQARIQLDRAQKLGVPTPPAPADLAQRPECLPMPRG